ncbi:hypothetical protein ZYGM_002792 [Zygosaccharomyces mellis]|uniref:ABC-2 type transporter domain-containing protein n=1 Tax=Zygosaccharomyces mellis TaxID=42258 RepID=A0A4C2E0P2_9SACH|nr:hypothetical protein ZYGM_002792 [Zygosaccharomyces mellis]
MSDYWRSSREYEELQQVIGQQLNHNHEESLDLLRNSRKAAQSKRVRTSSPYTVNYIMQVKYVMIRNFWRIVNSPGVTLIRFFGNIVMALVLGSMFYKVEKHTTTDTFYFRGAAMFYSILVNGFSSLLEIFALFEARPVTEKHKTYSLYHPSADALASVIADIPAKVLSSICFSVIFYFLVNFRRDPGRFFFYLLINVVVSFVMSHLFRCVGALSKTVVTAMVPASVLLLCVMLYTGFSIPKKSMHGWSKWIWYIDPLSYLFESLMTNEFHNRKFPCATYIPNGPQYQNNTGEQKVCSVVGSVPGQDYVLGDNYIKQSYEYEIQHKWRGFGVGMAYVVFFFFLYLFICEYNEAAKQKGDLLVFPRTVVKRMRQRNALKQPSSDSEDIEKSSALLANDATNKTLIMDSSESSLDEQIKTISLRQSDSVLKDRDDEGDNAEGHKSYATDIFSQILIVSHRFFQQYWRSPQYLWPKLFLTAFNEIFIGFTFFKEKRSLQGLQNQMLSTFVFCVIFNALLQQFLPVYVEQRNLYEARERPSRTFSWFTFIVSQIIVEVPWNFLAGTIAFFVYYYPVGFYQNASEAHQLHERGALYWLFCTAFFVWIGSMAILANSFVEYAAEASNLALLCFAFSLAFNGVLVPPSKMPHFWIFMHRVSPLTYYIDSALSVGMANVDLKCSEYEYVQFKPSVNQTCGQYMDPYIKSQGTGYLANPNSTGQCRFCPLSKTNDYLKSRSSYYSHRWRNYGIFICFIAFNYVAAIFLYWLARVPKGNRVSKKKKG